MPSHYSYVQALKRAVNLSLDPGLVAEARSLEIPLSSTCEEALRARVREVRSARWIEENKDSIADYNARVEAQGTFGEKFGNI